MFRKVGKAVADPVPLCRCSCCQTL